MSWIKTCFVHYSETIGFTLTKIDNICEPNTHCMIQIPIALITIVSVKLLNNQKTLSKPGMAWTRNDWQSINSRLLTVRPYILPEILNHKGRRLCYKDSMAYHYVKKTTGTRNKVFFSPCVIFKVFASIKVSIHLKKIQYPYWID